MPSSVSTEVIDRNTFHPFPDDALPLKASHSSNTTATESPASSDVDNTMQPESPQRTSLNRLPPESRSPNVNYGSPHRSPTVNTNSPMAHGGSPSDKGLVHTRTNFGKTRGYVPPMVPTSPPGRVTDPPNVPPSPRGNMMANRTLPFEEEDAPDDEARFRTIRSLRPKPSQYHSDGSNHSQPRRHDMQEMTAPVSPPRPEAYISETDESSLGQHGDFTPARRVLQPLPSVASQEQDARPPTPEQPYDVFPARSSKEHRSPSPIEHVQMSPIVRSRAKEKSSVPESPPRNVPQRSQSAPESPKSPRHRTAEELGDLRRRRRRIKNKKASEPPAPEQAPQQFAMPLPTGEPPAPERVTSSKTSSDLTDDPIPNFDDGNPLVKQVMESEIEYHEESTAVPPPPAGSPGYEEFIQDREASESPPKQKPKSILRPSRTTSKDAENDDDDDSLFDFASASGDKLLGATASIRKSSLKSGNNSSSRKGRPRRRRSEESGNDDDESLIQYGEVRKRSSSLQERTQEAWTFRSKRSFSASSPKVTTAGVHFENTNTVHHFDDQETVGTNHSLNSLYTKSPESEAEDLIKDLLMIGSGEHSNPGRRKIKYQPAYKRELKEKDDKSVDDNTLGTTDISLNTLDHTAAETAYTEATPPTGVDDDAKLGTSPKGKSDGLSRSACETLDTKSTKNNAEDPLAAVWDLVESGMQALGLSSNPTDPPSEPTEDKVDERKVVEKAMSGEDPVATETPEEVPAKETNSEEELAKETNAEEGVLQGVTSSDLQGIKSFRTADYPGEDEVKEDPTGSFGEVMDYIFGDPLQKEKQDKQTNVSSAATATTSSTLLEEDPRLEDLALHAVKSKHQMFDLVYDESVSFDAEKDIKFSLVKTMLPLGILFHENDGGCWITKVFPDGNAAKSGGVEVGDQLAAINGISAIKLRVDQICTLITEAPNPDNIELTFLRYTGQLHPVGGDKIEEPYETFEVTDQDALMKPPINKKHNSLRSLPTKLRHRDPSPKPKKSPKREDEAHKHSKGKTKGKKGLGKWFKGKKKSQATL